LEQSNLLRIISTESEHMDRIGHLNAQIARAERLSNSAFDKLTVERLHAFAAECRAELALLKDRKSQHGVSCRISGTASAQCASRIALDERPPGLRERDVGAP
jgi:PIN domain nuclease of toxin-antitoxin system